MMSIQRCFWTAVLVVLASTASAQSSRTEAITSQQATKANALEPEEQSRAEELLNRFVLPTDPDGLYPFFASPFPGGSFPVGIAYQRHLPRGARASVGGSWSARNFKLIEGRFGMPFDRDHRVRVDVVGRWVDAPELPFYGFGGDTTSDDRTDFGYRPSAVSATVTARPLSWLRMNGGYTFQSAATTSDDDDDELSERFTPGGAPGLGQDLAYNVVHGGVAFDTRPSPAYADRGSMLRADWARFSERDGKPFSFDQTEVEAVQLVPLVGRYFVLAFRGLATFTEPHDGDTVPFMLAPLIGSGDTVRGFPNRRFQDRYRVVLNGEYRWEASRHMDMALFYDAGQVQPDTDRIRWRAFETAWGIGARFHTPVANVLRLEMARSREGWVLVGGASQAF